MKLSPQKVRAIRRFVRVMPLTQASIGNIFNVAQNTVSNVKTRTTWRHIQ